MRCAWLKSVKHYGMTACTCLCRRPICSGGTMDKLKSIDWKKEGRQLVRDYIMVVLGSLLLALA